MNDFHFNFSVLLTLLTVVTGIVWMLDKWLLGPRRRLMLAPGTPDEPNGVIDFCRSFFPVIGLVLVLRTFIAEPFRIPSGSMIPTLNVGDFILVNKFAFGLRDPVFHKKIVAFGEPQRGDIVVFRWPKDTTKDFIKRIVGVPGDHIEYREKTLYVNGDQAAQVADGVYTGPYGSIYRFQENLGGVEHQIIVQPSHPSGDFEFTVPAGQYYAMGDNRDGSDDSRYWGTVPEENLVGRAFFIWLNLVIDSDGYIPKDIHMDTSRIGTRLK